LTYALVKLPEHGTVTLDGPVVTYTPDTNYNGPDSFTFQASDGSGSADEATVTISVNPVNDAPVAADDAAVTEEDLAVLLFPLANDGDLDNDLLFVAWTSAPASGSAAVNLDGTITYVPAPDFHGLDLFQYGVIDPSGALAVATVMVTVLPVNDAPVGFGDAAETLEDVAVTVDVLANDQDVDGDLLTLAAVDAPAHGTAVLAGSGAVTYAPAPDFHGTDTFTYAVVDPTGAAATATVTVTVLAVNDAPVARDDEGWTLEDTGTGLDLLANDDDVDDNLVAESLAVLTDPAHGVAVVDEDTLLVMYTPEPDYSGVDGFTYQICDEELVCTSASVSVLIEAVNDAPAAADDLATTAEDAPLAIDVLANDTDVDGEELTVAAVASPAHGEAVLGPDGRITYTPDRDFHGTDTFEYTVADEAGLTDTATVTVTVSPVDDAPEAAADGYDAPEDTLLTVPAPGVLANDLDADDDTLAALLVQAPAHGVLTLAANGAFTYLPEPDFAGIDTFTYQASDGDLTSAPVLVTITVAPVNDAPQILDHGFTVEEDGLLLVETPGVLTGATDPEGDPLAARVVVGPAHGALELNPDGSFTYVPDADWAGADLFTYQATDGLLESRVATVAIAVAEVNDAPVAGDDTALTEAGVAVTLAVLANDRDVDGDPLSLVAAGAGALGTVTIGEAGLLTYLPPAGFIGDDAFSYTVSDGRGGLATAQVVVTVTGGGGDLRVSVDIHPTSCPNPINIGKKGVVPAAVLGAVGFDVTRIDPTSVQLVSLAPSRSALEDVTTPYVPFTGTGGAYECTTAGSDGQRDLTLKFDSLKLATAIDQWLGRPAANGEVLVLPLTGNLKAEFGGTPFSGADVVKILR
jgi:VCBS repeat-containing protein